MIFQEPMSALSPLHTVGNQVAEVLQEIANRGISTLLVEQKLAIAMDIAHRVYDGPWSGGV